MPPKLRVGLTAAGFRRSIGDTLRIYIGLLSLPAREGDLSMKLFTLTLFESTILAVKGAASTY